MHFIATRMSSVTATELRGPLRDRQHSLSAHLLSITWIGQSFRAARFDLIAPATG